MRLPLAIAALLALTLAAPGSAAAQQVPNLSGTWVLQVDKSNFGPMPGPSECTEVVEHVGPMITVKATGGCQPDGSAATIVVGVDGKPYKNFSGGVELTSTLKWEGTALVMVSTFAAPQGEGTLTDRMTLSPDGKTMTQARIVSFGGQELPQTLVWAKQ